MPDKTWKSVERRLARMAGAERNQDTHGFDFETVLMRVEVKHRTIVPKLCLDALEQVQATPDIGARIPVAVVHQKGQRLEDSIALVRYGDLIHWHRLLLEPA